MTQRSCSKLLVFTFLFMSLLLSACKTNRSLSSPDAVSGELEELVDKSLLTGEPCAPPCWYGIIPGKTSETDALGIVNGLEFINRDTIMVHEGVRGGTVSWQTVFDEDSSLVEGLSFDESGVVYQIGMILRYPMTLQGVIDVIGDPDGLMSSLIMGYDGSANDKSIDIVWFDEGLEAPVAYLPISERTSSSVVEPDSSIRYLTYFPSVSSVGEYIHIRGKDPADFVQWEGFDK